MQTLITREEIRQYKQVSKTYNDDKLKEQIIDAQLTDLLPLIGERLYNKIIASPGSYTDLLNGSSYTHNGINYSNYGLKMVLAYYTYARYVYFGSQIDTPFGLVEKTTDVSERVNVAQKKSIYQENRNTAFSIWENIRLFLLRTEQEDYKSYYNDGVCGHKTASSFKIKKIG